MRGKTERKYGKQFCQQMSRDIAMSVLAAPASGSKLYMMRHGTHQLVSAQYYRYH